MTCAEKDLDRDRHFSNRRRRLSISGNEPAYAYSDHGTWRGNFRFAELSEVDRALLARHRKVKAVIGAQTYDFEKEPTL